MPQPFNNAVMTNAGANLLTRSQAGEGAIIFTKMATGNGTYSAAEKTLEALQQRTALKSIKNSYAPSSITKESDFSVKIVALITNMDPLTKETLVTEGYFINEIGLFAKIAGDSEEVLYSIAITSGAQGDFMPPYNGQNPAQITQGYLATVSNTATVNLEAPTSAVALASDLQKIGGNFAAAEKMIGANAVNIVALTIAVSLLQGAAVAGTSDNIFVETFADDSGFRISEGIYDQEHKRIYA